MSSYPSPESGGYGPTLRLRVSQKSALFALIAYVGVLAGGRGIDLTTGGSGLTAETVSATLTVELIAPLCALAASLLGARVYCRAKTPAEERGRLHAAALAVLAVTAVTFTSIDSGAAPTALMIGCTALVVMRAAIIERNSPHRVIDYPDPRDRLTRSNREPSGGQPA